MKTGLFITTLAALLLFGCASNPGHVGETRSLLDGERRIVVTPAWLHGGGAGGGFNNPGKAGGFWTEKAPGTFYLTIAVIGAENVTALKIGIDGSVQDFSPTSAPTDIITVLDHLESHRTFAVPLSVVEQMVASDRVGLRIEMPSKYVEANFSHDYMTFARPAFRKALQQIRGEKKA